MSLQLNDYANAETNLRRLLELDYRDKDGVRLYLGQIAEEQDKFDEALRWYREVGPGTQYVAGQIRYAVVLSKQGRVDDALDYLRKSALDDGGITYKADKQGGGRPPITAAAVVCWYNAGDQENPLCKKAIEYVKKHLQRGDSRGGNLGHY